MKDFSIKLFLLAMMLSVFSMAAVYSQTPISTAAEFLSMLPGGDYYLTQDIVLPTNQMYTGTFTGLFDGNGHKITVDITSTAANVGLFSQVGNGYSGEIRNLIIEGSVTGSSSANQCTGGFVGKAMSPFEFNYCTNLAEVTGYKNVGGIIGETVIGTGGHIGSHFCVNQGSVRGQCVAGIIGAVNSWLIMGGCKNAGTIIGFGEIQVYMAGIIGYISSVHVNIAFPVNIGRILSSNSQYAGGIVAYFNGIGFIATAVNSGIIDGATNSVGGIVGYFNLITSAGSNRNVADCINTNWVDPSGTYVGAIVGRNNSGANVFDCYYDNQMCVLTSGIGSGGSGIGNGATGLSTVNMIGTSLPPPFDGWSRHSLLYPVPVEPSMHSISLLAAAPVYLMNNEKVNNITTFPFYVSNYNTTIPPYIIPAPYYFQWSSFSSGGVISVPTRPNNGATKNISGQDTLRVKIDNEPYEKVVPVNTP